MTFYMVCA